MNLLTSAREAVKPQPPTPLEVAAERVAEIDRDIQKAEIEHQKRLATVGIVEADLTKVETERRGLEARRDTLGSPDPAALDRRIAAARKREEELRQTLAGLRDSLLSTPMLLSQLREDRSAAETDRTSAEYQESGESRRVTMRKLLDLEPMLRTVLTLKNMELRAYGDEAALRASLPLSMRHPLPPEPFFGRGLEEFLQTLDTHRALGQR